MRVGMSREDLREDEIDRVRQKETDRKEDR